MLFPWGFSLPPAPDRYVASGSSVTRQTSEGAAAPWGQWQIPVLVLWQGRGQRAWCRARARLHLWKVVLVPLVPQRVCCDVGNAVCAWAGVRSGAGVCVAYPVFHIIFTRWLFEWPIAKHCKEILSSFLTISVCSVYHTRIKSLILEIFTSIMGMFV